MSLAVMAPPASAVISGRADRLAFERAEGGNADVILMEGDGTNETRPSANHPTAADSRPDWAPYSALRLSDIRLAAAPPGDPGSHAARGEQVALSVSGGLAGQSTLLVSFNGAHAAPATVDADGNALVTVPPDATSGPVCVGQPGALGLAPGLTSWTSTADTFSDPFTVDGAPPGPARGCRSSQPIAFQSNRTGDYDIWALDPALGGDAVNLIRRPASHETAPAWSPTTAQAGGIGSRFDERPLLAFQSDARGNRDILLLDPARPLDGDNPRPLTTSPADDANPDWSPDGSAIAFESDRDGDKAIWVIRRDETGRFVPEANLMRVTVDQPPSFEPSWFFFGQQENPTAAIVFSGAEEGEGCDLHYSSWEGQALPPPDPARITTLTIPGDSGKDDNPAWSPIGGAIAFHRTVNGRDTILRLDRGLEAADERLVALTEGRPGRDRHPAWQSTRLEAQVSFYRPLGRVRPRRRRAAAATARVAQFERQGCAESPQAAFEVTPQGASPGTSLRFDARASGDRDGRIDAYEWDLDDDGSFEVRTSEPVLVRAISRAGVHDVELRVVDDDGMTDTARRTVAVGVRSSTTRCTKRGTRRSEHLRGTRGRDVLCGLGGDDRLLGLGGNDELVGGSGRDSLHGGSGRDRLGGGPGRDLLRAGPGADRGRGDSGADRVFGDAGGDSLDGGSGDDRVAGGAGGDSIAGGRGRDHLTGNGGRDAIRARDRARDRVDGGSSRDRAVVDRRLDNVRRVERVLRR